MSRHYLQKYTCFYFLFTDHLSGLILLIFQKELDFYAFGNFFYITILRISIGIIRTQAPRYV